MVDDSELETSNGPGSFAGGFNGDNQQTMLLSPAPTAPVHHHLSHPQDATVPPPSHSGFPSMTHIIDQNLDWDPFGLTASMTFPNQQHFAFDQPNLR